jgi:hypothetical protein
MWGTVLKYIPALLLNSVGPIIDLVKGKQTDKLKQIKTLCDHADGGLLSDKDALQLIRELFKS